jgi:signal transduction histidine kinase
MMQTGEHWDYKSVTVVNLVDLGASLSERGETNRPTIVLPRRDPAAGPREDERDHPRSETRTNELATATNLTRGDFVTTNQTERRREDRERRGWPPFGRPPFRMSEEEYKALRERRGLHGLVIAMSTEAYGRACRQDLWMRWVIGSFGAVSAVGLGLAWRNLAKSSELQMRLLRASELNTHLKEMNLAAAGLAHETRNPLNIIRGLAQMISKQQDASTEVRRKTREIIDETDRVTAQLNEFINYSRPREVRRATVSLAPVVNEVARALSYDLEEKCVRLRVPEELPAIDADEQLLRQALFNLLMNAVQAVERGGDIEVAAWKQNSQGVVLEIRDDGPGVPPKQRSEIFKPYFTTHQKGTGLGLAVVQQIVLAHGWEIECLANQPRGAIFRLSHLRAVTKL